MESSSGSATVTPMPRRTLRRERCFLVRNIIVLLQITEPVCHNVVRHRRRIRLPLVSSGMAVLFTIARTKARIGCYSVAASLTTARTTGISDGSSTRPSP